MEQSGKKVFWKILYSYVEKIIPCEMSKIQIWRCWQMVNLQNIIILRKDMPNTRLDFDI